MNVQVETAEAILREFVADVMACYDNDYDKAVDTLTEEWLDLANTFARAYRFLNDAS